MNEYIRCGRKLGKGIRCKNMKHIDSKRCYSCSLDYYYNTDTPRYYTFKYNKNIILDLTL